ncbi:MAG: type II toxin-antitoxin system HicA family toxin [Comamonadaceae bacterium]|jgi:predicted RNA binding protein YcfA (HicA-like mRNA interferase family)|nr:type II toxin-antitoxin system HicA family toxin [Comamonadaceae bacterium]
MSKHQKALEKLRKKPPPSDFKWTELQALLLHLGYKQLNNSGSRRKFFHKGTGAVISCHEPHPDPNVDKGCIVDVVQHLTDYGLI